MDNTAEKCSMQILFYLGGVHLVCTLSNKRGYPDTPPGLALTVNEHLLDITQAIP
jgi:hypothetical protein